MSFLESMDRIILLDKGEIVADGRFKDLNRTNDVFKDFISSAAKIEQQETDLADESAKEMTDAEDEDLIQALNRHRAMSIVSSSIRGEEHHEDNKIVVEEKSAQGRVDIRHFSYFFKKAGLSVCAMIVVLFIIAEGFNTGASILLGLWADKINELEGRAEKEDHMFYIYWFSGIIAAIFVFGALRMFAIFYNCALASKKIHDATLTSLFHSPMSFFDTNPTGRILNRFSSDMDMIDLTMPFRIGDLLECLATTIAILGLVAWNAPAILILLAPLAVLCVFIQIFFGRTKRQLKRLDAVNRSPIYAHFSETIQGTSVIRAYKSEERYKGRDSKCD